MMRGLSRTFAALAITGLLVAAPAVAQPNQGRGPRADRGNRADRMERMERRLDVLEARLDLTDEQRTEIEALMATQRADAEKWLEANPDATPGERLDFRIEHRQEMLAAMEEVLTPEQRTKFAEIREDMADRGPRGRRGRR